LKWTDVSEVLIASIIRAITSETSVCFYKITRRYIPEDSQLHVRRRENLESHSQNLVRQTNFIREIGSIPNFFENLSLIAKIGGKAIADSL
jgi:hypothetical protein